MVVTREEPPYVMIKCGNCTGNERYEGFAIDLLAAISQVNSDYIANNKISQCCSGG